MTNLFKMLACLFLGHRWTGGTDDMDECSRCGFHEWEDYHKGVKEGDGE